MTSDCEVVDLNLVRLARLVGSVERVAGWCEWQARAVDDEEGDEEPLSNDERVVLSGWCEAFRWLADELRAVNRTETSSEPLEAVRIIRGRVAKILDESDRAIDAGLATCDSIPELLATQGRLHGLRIARERLHGLTRSESEPPLG